MGEQATWQEFTEAEIQQLESTGITAYALGVFLGALYENCGRLKPGRPEIPEEEKCGAC